MKTQRVIKENVTYIFMFGKYCFILNYYISVSNKDTKKLLDTKVVENLIRNKFCSKLFFCKIDSWWVLISEKPVFTTFNPQFVDPA